MRHSQIAAAIVAITLATSPVAYAATGVSAGTSTTALVDAIAQAETKIVSAPLEGDPYAQDEAKRSDPAYTEFENAVKDLIDPESNLSASSLVWVRQDGATTLEWTGSVDASTISNLGRRVMWTCRDTESGRIVAIAYGTVDEATGKLTSVSFKKTSEYAAYMDKVAVVNAVNQIGDAIKDAREPYTDSRKITDDDRASVMEMRMKARGYDQEAENGE